MKGESPDLLCVLDDMCELTEAKQPGMVAQCISCWFNPTETMKSPHERFCDNPRISHEIKVFRGKLTVCNRNLL